MSSGYATAWLPMPATLRAASGPELKIELLCDGAPEMWNLLEEGFLPKFGNDSTALVDLHHLMEKLGAAAARDRRLPRQAKGSGVGR